MLSTLALTALTLAPAATDAPMRLISRHGVELRADEDVFVLFAALNAAGFAEETERKGPPLRAPVYHPIRIEVRDALLKVRDQTSMDAVRDLFEKNPGEIEDYLAATLGGEQAAGPVAKIAPKLRAAFAKLREQGKLVALFDRLAERQRSHARALKSRLEKSFDAAARRIGGEGLRAPQNLVVIPNPLDAHGAVRRVAVKDVTYLVVGPGHATAERAILKAALRGAVRAAVDKAYPSARGYARSWDGLKTSRRIREGYQDGPTYLTEALTRALTFRILTPDQDRDRDEDFIDEQAKDGIRWARAALKVVDGAADSTLDDALGGLLTKIVP